VLKPLNNVHLSHHPQGHQHPWAGEPAAGSSRCSRDMRMAEALLHLRGRDAAGIGRLRVVGARRAHAVVGRVVAHVGRAGDGALAGVGIAAGQRAGAGGHHGALRGPSQAVLHAAMRRCGASCSCSVLLGAPTRFPALLHAHSCQQRGTALQNGGCTEGRQQHTDTAHSKSSRHSGQPAHARTVLQQVAGVVSLACVASVPQSLLVAVEYEGVACWHTPPGTCACAGAPRMRMLFNASS